MDYSTVETSARVVEWRHLNSRQLARLDRDSTVVVVSCSPLEVHGPHLPLETDIFESEVLGLEVMERLCDRHPELSFVHLPPVYVAADVVAQRGSLAFRPSTITRVLSDLGRTLGRQGFRRIWVFNFHGGPRHALHIELAAHHCNRRYDTEMVSVFSLLLNQLTEGGDTDLSGVLGGRCGLTADQLRGDTHGGAVETSLLLRFSGHRVDPGYGELPPMTVERKLEQRGEPPLRYDSVRELFRGFRAKMLYFLDETYAGDPALGSAEVGQAIADELSRTTADSLSDLWLGRITADQCHSPLWKMRWAFKSATLGRLVERAFGFHSPIF